MSAEPEDEDEDDGDEDEGDEDEAPPPPRCLPEGSSAVPDPPMPAAPVRKNDGDVGTTESRGLPAMRRKPRPEPSRAVKDEADDDVEPIPAPMPAPEDEREEGAIGLLEPPKKDGRESRWFASPTMAVIEERLPEPTSTPVAPPAPLDEDSKEAIALADETPAPLAPVAPGPGADDTSVPPAAVAAVVAAAAADDAISSCRHHSVNWLMAAVRKRSSGTAPRTMSSRWRRRQSRRQRRARWRSEASSDAAGSSADDDAEVEVEDEGEADGRPAVGVAAVAVGRTMDEVVGGRGAGAIETASAGGGGARAVGRVESRATNDAGTMPGSPPASGCARSQPRAEPKRSRRTPARSRKWPGRPGSKSTDAASDAAHKIRRTDSRVDRTDPERGDRGQGGDNGGKRKRQRTDGVRGRGRAPAVETAHQVEVQLRVPHARTHFLVPLACPAPQYGR